MRYDFDQLTGSQVSLHRFDESCITPEYMGWLQDTEVLRYSSQRCCKHTEQTCSAYLASFVDNANLFIAIRMRHSGRMVRTMTAYVAVPHGTADIGLMVGDRAQWGKGIGLDAWQTLMHYLLSECRMRKVTGGTLRCNVGMVRIMERSGMHLEAVRAKQQMVEGEAQDELYYAKFGNRIEVADSGGGARCWRDQFGYGVAQGSADGTYPHQRRRSGAGYFCWRIATPDEHGAD